MLKLQPDILDAILKGESAFGRKVIIYFQSPEIYTQDNYLHSIRGLSMNMSDDGGYVASNTTIVLKNIDRYFSVFFNRELPIKKLVVIFLTIDGTDIEIFKGVVASWVLNESTVELNINI